MDNLPALHTGKARVEFGHVTPIDETPIPFAIIESGEPGPTLLITAGVHGSEFCSAEAAVRMMQTKPEEIKGTLVVLPILNVQGFHKRNIYIMPQDGKNLNRMFPGKPDGSTSERLANWLVTKVYPEVDAYIDMHGGDLDEGLEPFTIFPAGSEKSQAMAKAFGIPVLVAAGGAGYTVDASNKLGIPSILPEVSGNGLWGDATVTQMTDGVRGVMHHLGMIANAPKAASAETKVVTMWVPTAPVTGLWYPRKDLTETVAAGELLGEIKTVFGEVLASIHSEKAGFILYRLTSLSVNQGEALLGVGTPVSA
ncbi:MAG: succinylglutamate desuccinylase/aspartoacylase family protein [Rhizobiaceae bacterium]|nr:succinylglutamate desuccinylase/aspartoacylase family protein [Rhizobiaceae bacterium]